MPFASSKPIATSLVRPRQSFTVRNFLVYLFLFVVWAFVHGPNKNVLRYVISSIVLYPVRGHFVYVYHHELLVPSLPGLQSK